MNPLFLELSQNLDKLAARSDILAAIDELEDQFDALSDIEQEIAARMSERAANLSKFCDSSRNSGFIAGYSH